MTLRAAAMRMITRAITSPGLRALNHRLHRQDKPMIEYFHQGDDPYSHLVVQVLPRLAARYRVEVRCRLVPPPDDAAAPERERLNLYAIRDAARVAQRFGLSFPDGAQRPDSTAIHAANSALAGRLASFDAFCPAAVEIGSAFWTGGALPPGIDPAEALATGQAERERLGHYLGGMLYFEGEWFWGVDRINHLESRLRARGLDTAPPGTPDICPYQGPALGPVPVSGAPVQVELWFSIRSPYSWIVFPRAVAIAQHYGAELVLRPILPMVMRGLPVPRIKSRYIMLDTKREAERCGLPFGTIVDPVGKGAEQALALTVATMPLGLGEAFAERALRGAWAEGVDLAEVASIRRLGEAAGLTRAQVDAALADDGWRAVVEANREVLFEAGLWGPPSFRVNGGAAHWGQDRLWLLEEDILRAMSAT